MHIIQQGSTLVLYNDTAFKKGVIFHPAGAQRWVEGIKPPPTPIPPPPPSGGNNGGGTNGNNDGVVAKMASYVGSLKYSQGAGRLNPDKSGYSDCSALIWFCYHKIRGINVGQWSGAQATRGTNIYTGTPSGAPFSSLQKGDVIVWNRKRTGVPKAGKNEGHAALWYGDGNKIIDHGSGIGPKIRAYSTFNYAPWVTIRRHN